MGEDISLCARLGAVGIPVHVDTSTRTNHLKRVWVGEGHFEVAVLTDVSAVRPGEPVRRKRATK